MTALVITVARRRIIEKMMRKLSMKKMMMKNKMVLTMRA